MSLGPRRQGSGRGARALSYDPRHTAEFYDEYGEREWSRFEDGRNSPTSLEVHRHYLRRFVGRDNRVLDAGAGPGRFTLELAELGAVVTVADVSARQLELNRERVAAAGLEAQVAERVVADVVDLSRFAADEFDATVCYGGPLSYVVDRAETAVAELVRVTKPGGHLLVSVMSLVGSMWHYFDVLLELLQRDGVARTDEIVRTGFLPEGEGYGHLPMRLFRWRELQSLLEPYGEIVAASAAGLFKPPPLETPALRDLLTRLEVELAAEPGAIDGGEHILAVVQVR